MRKIIIVTVVATRFLCKIETPLGTPALWSHLVFMMITRSSWRAGWKERGAFLALLLH